MRFLVFIAIGLIVGFFLARALYLGPKDDSDGDEDE
tara:strand:+ start:526 stop:633 length:108 start_codon:yes stop_codon:yes gene_type:complete